ncbi:GGDEF domain-containing protein [Fundidesulfovibrio soli]|uniref:GGDEF domain-containing protein n=1 Tax=Fundidesulfovibrio soli TaxID=2922716 RepID=UPI001FAF7983|nr:GGDEF domain-containing protein [Fundidesulfovibrio soli]
MDHVCSEIKESCDIKKLCASLAKAGTPQDVRWKSLFLFVSFIKEIQFLSSAQKEDIQLIALEALKSLKFDNDSFADVSNRIGARVTSESIDSVNKMFDEIVQAINASKEVIKKRCNNLVDFNNELSNDMRKFSSIEEAVQFVNRNVSEFADLLAQDAESLDAICNLDPLTGLRNRRCFELTVEQLVKSTFEGSRPAYVAMLDVDNFKKFNDSYGHLVGDQVLREVGNLLNEVESKANSPQSGFLAGRYGGEEFVVYLDGVDDEKAFMVAEHIRRSLESKVFKARDVDGALLYGGLKITCSIGLAKLHNDGGKQCYLSALKRADEALYFSKKSGKNRTSVQ